MNAVDLSGVPGPIRKELSQQLVSGQISYGDFMDVVREYRPTKPPQAVSAGSRSKFSPRNLNAQQTSTQPQTTTRRQRQQQEQQQTQDREGRGRAEKKRTSQPGDWYAPPPEVKTSGVAGVGFWGDVLKDGEVREDTRHFYNQEEEQEEATAAKAKTATELQRRQYQGRGRGRRNNPEYFKSPTGFGVSFPRVFEQYLVGHRVTVELKCHLMITGTMHASDKFMNLLITNATYTKIPPEDPACQTLDTDTPKLARDKLWEMAEKKVPTVSIRGNYVRTIRMDKSVPVEFPTLMKACGVEEDPEEIFRIEKLYPTTKEQWVAWYEEDVERHKDRRLELAEQRLEERLRREKNPTKSTDEIVREEMKKYNAEIKAKNAFELESTEDPYADFCRELEIPARPDFDDTAEWSDAYNKWNEKRKNTENGLHPVLDASTKAFIETDWPRFKQTYAKLPKFHWSDVDDDDHAPEYDVLKTRYNMD